MKFDNKLSFINFLTKVDSRVSFSIGDNLKFTVDLCIFSKSSQLKKFIETISEMQTNSNPKSENLQKKKLNLELVPEPELILFKPSTQTQAQVQKIK
jgi:hypothetical protein